MFELGTRLPHGPHEVEIYIYMWSETQTGITQLLGAYELELTAKPGRTARTASVTLRAVDIVLTLKDPASGKTVSVKLSAVNAREMGTCPQGEDPVDWLLLTNRSVTTLKAARAAVLAYTFRWRIEEFHKSWKSGHCNVEDSQLRSEEAIRKWAIVLAAVASRVERLKLLARRVCLPRRRPIVAGRGDR